MWKGNLTSKRRQAYDGKSKTLYEGPEAETYVQYFKDTITSTHAEKKGVYSGKGVLCNRISAHLMTKLEAIGIPTHFIRSINMREQLVHKLDMIPLEVTVRNIAAGELVSKFDVKEGTVLPRPIVEFHLKNDKLRDPMVCEDHIVAFNWADPYELEEIVMMVWRINDYLNGLFSGIGVKLVDFKVEFGRMWGEDDELYIILADEISPDVCRLWDAKTDEKLDKDLFREGKDGVVEAYQEIAKRLGLIPESGILEGGNMNEQIAAQLGEIENVVSPDRRKLRSIKTPPRKS
ncbi:MAG: phosphoribosylaminoimidazolesuccinocarboxamide synthase [Alphaproteobacteria bacterium]|nr:phosphoribosylaminoimidazolesuccinocarboxamide synthase [Alphaproteobacteria bacterium]